MNDKGTRNLEQAQLDSGASIARTRGRAGDGQMTVATTMRNTATATAGVRDDSDDPVRALSIVVPCRNEEGNLPELHRRLVATLEGIELPFEIIIVDDGSDDGTWATIKALNADDPRVVGLRHRRNFGKARGLSNGFAVARGDVIITMDGDLQDDPDELPRFLDKLNEGYDLVSGWKRRRRDPFGKTFPSKIFNWTVRRASNVRLHDFNCGFKAYRREVTESIRLYGELHRFTPVLAHAEGFRIGELSVTHHPRTWGQSKYGWGRLVKGFLDLLTVTFLTQYRHRPMHLFGLPGLLALGVGVMIGLWLSGDKLLTGAEIGTRPLLLLAVLLVVIGAQFFGLGLIGEMQTHGDSSPPVRHTSHLRATIGLDGRVAHLDSAGANGATPGVLAGVTLTPQELTGQTVSSVTETP